MLYKKEPGCLEYSIIIVLAVALAGVIDLFIAWVFQYLWNWIIVYLFHVPEIGYWMSFGVIMLLTIIGGFFKSSSSHKE